TRTPEGGSGVRVFATTENGHRGPSLGAGAAGVAGAGIAGVGIAGVGIAGVGRDASPPGLAGGAGRGSDGAAPVVVGALACWGQLYPIAPMPRIARAATSAVSHIDPPPLGASSRRRLRSV